MTDMIEGKTALVTGGGSGIGRSTAIAFAAAGANVVVADVDEAGGKETVALIEAASGTSMFVTANVAQAAEVESMVNATVAAYGGLDCAFNNAGIQGALSQTADCTEENWDQITGINLKGVWLCMKYEIAAMLKSGGGAIVNNSSNFGLVGSIGMPAYSAAKHGLIGLTKTAALEYAQSGIRVNAVCPGPVQTPLVDKILSAQPDLAEGIIKSIEEREPIGRFGRPEEIASAVVWLCSPEASFVVGSILPVDGGFVAQ
jgi:NAD(P)-dependent dehydrogenase (short-subunit alcohol dehydrogenase family)